MATEVIQKLYKIVYLVYNGKRYRYDFSEDSNLKKIFVLIIALVIILTIPVVAFAENDNDAAATTIPEETAAPVEDAPADAAQPEAEATPTPVPTPEPTPTPEQTTQGYAGAPEVDLSRIEAESAMLVDADTGEVLFSKNADWRIFPASTTKLMTAILTEENCELTDMVTLTADMLTEIGKLGEKGSLMGLYTSTKPGTEISVKDLFYGMMMCSGNDAALALGLHIAGSEEAFVAMMNAKAQELGMTGTNFINTNGVYIANIGHDHYSTASDMAKLAVAASKYPELMEIVKSPTYTYETVPQLNNETVGGVQNSNYLLHTPVEKPEYAQYLYDKATGMKTGTVNNIIPPGAERPIKSYGCLVASASSDGLNLIAVIFGDTTKSEDTSTQPDSHARWDIAKYLFDYGFENFAKVDLAKYASPVALTEQIENASGNDPQEGTLEVSADLSKIASDTQLIDAATAKGLEDGSVKLEETTNISEPLKAPIKEGDEVGTVSYSLNGKELYSAPLVAGREVFEKGEESLASEEYGVPYFEFQTWYLWIIIPVALILTLLIIRAVNKSRRKKRYATGRGRNYDTPVRQPQRKQPPNGGMSRSATPPQKRQGAARARTGGKPGDSKGRGHKM